MRAWPVYTRLATLGLLLCAMAAAQERDRYTIQVEAHATIEAIPEYAEFWLHRQVPITEELPAAEASAQVLALEDELRAGLEARELSPRVLMSDLRIGAVSLKSSAARLPSVEPSAASVSARLQFTILGYSTAENGPAQYAALVDKVRAVAKELDCGIEGPFLRVLDAKPVEAEAVAAAVENAYAPAEGAARVMRSQIVAVEHVDIRSIGWNSEPGQRESPGTLSRIACTARVLVSYVYDSL